jgi:hypothetical protein
MIHAAEKTAGHFSYEDKLKCAERELKQRYRVYTRRVDNGTMTKAQMDREIALMEEIAADYRALAETGRLL